MQRTHQCGFVAGSGFQDEVDFCPKTRRLGRAEQLQDAGVTFGIVVDAVADPAQTQLKSGLGNVDASVDGSGEVVVLTHTC